MEDTLEELKLQAPTADAYDNLTKVITFSFQKGFEKLRDLNEKVELTPNVGPFDSRWGEEGVSDWNQEYKLLDESTNEDIATMKKECKCKETEKINRTNPLEQTKGFSQAQIDQAIQETLIVEQIEENPNPLLGISYWYMKGRLFDYHFATYNTFNIPSPNLEELYLPLSQHERH
ncbi:unnamed protein product [Lactuca virosa]|uniref:Uncharacterized protein n=1 Tax=Lactuca virosa TaxID=75947 RepID=A0AAU9LBB9_9ASTR|nr:unnamed protein product [Lactuca virosa]